VSASSSAPGKILIAGEYAVLDGGEAVVMAVNRRARARLGQQEAAPSRFLAAAAAAVREELGSDRAAIVERAAVDSSSLRDEAGAKLGLGSSAAAVTAAVALALPPPGDRRVLHRLAHRAHAAAQGGTGSGADVAASVWGGVMVCRPPDRAGDPLRVARLALPADLVLVPVWLGQPADTRALVAEVAAFAAREPSMTAALYARIAGAAAELADALRAEQAIAALWQGQVALAELGRASGVAIVTDAHRRLDERAQALGGLAKPTGAGGGDIALGAFAGPEAAEQFRADARSLGMKVLDLSVDPDGARLEPGAG
jgi:phosphomevalonate kinase